MITQPEKYLCPKDISLALLNQYGLDRSAGFVRAIRRVSIKSGDKLFVSGEARASAVFGWLESHPEFRAQPMASRKREQLAA